MKVGDKVLYWSELECEIIEILESKAGTPVYVLKSMGGDIHTCAWDEPLKIINKSNKKKI